MTSKQKGNITELECITFFIKHNYQISIPFGENSRYDFILDTGKNLLKIQCKTSRPGRTKNSICIATQSNHTNTKHNKQKRYNKLEIDFFATFYNNCYLIPVEICTSSYKQFHIGLPKNNQAKNINFLENYSALKLLDMLP